MSQPDILLDDDKVSVVRKTVQWVSTTNSTPDIALNPDSASLRLGGGGGSHSDGDLQLTGEDGSVRFHASAGGGSFDPKTTRILFHGNSGTMRLGAKGLEDEDGNDIADVAIRPRWAALTLGGGGGSNSDGDIKLRDRDGKTRIHFTGGKGNSFDSTRVEIDGKDGDVKISAKEGPTFGHLGCSDPPEPNQLRYVGSVTKGSLQLGGTGVDGTLELDDVASDKRIQIGGYRTGDNPSASVDDPATRVRITMYGDLELGGGGVGGSIAVTDDQDTETMTVDGTSADLTVGSSGQNSTNGRLFVGGSWERSGVEIEGDYLGLGVETDEFRSHRSIELDGEYSTIDVYDSGNNERINMSGNLGSIALSALSQNGGTYQSVTLSGDAATITLSNSNKDTVVIDGENGDIQVGVIQSLVSTIQDLQNRVAGLENRVSP
ncbi:hypothetical protein BM92_00715 [Haloferax mediterranei ATCC 33500]|uniref:Uncharacterized protein n=1 Tax=Haloferax mediterranei (strain ATCC 33500 / DSM 1411 / JCM 8866 / NBRC 14739 / NCIMB 2177 / R-4) TaxID=523841 RepID=A0A059TP23_HALMT|nr:hypothetical protein [Haloferax mediterranei]AHZ21264.1 hypothetical protein BM92_00715 [Haloferax mediterranei ATCC 33500]